MGITTASSNVETANLTASTALLGTPRSFSLGGETGGGMSPQKLAAARKEAKDFEAFYVTSMLESMYAGMKPDAMFGGGSGEQMYRSMLNQEYGKEIAKRGSIGISDAILSDMLRLQEKH